MSAYGIHMPCAWGGGLGQGCAHLHTRVWWMRGEDQDGESFFKALTCSSGPSPCFGLIHRERKVSRACLVHQDPRERREPG